MDREYARRGRCVKARCNPDAASRVERVMNRRSLARVLRLAVLALLAAWALPFNQLRD